MRLLPLLLLAACPDNVTGFQPPDTDEPEDTGDTDTDTTPVDTADTDGDLDDDGFTPEEGDCDDSDIRVSPIREEEARDEKDNDCDGRVDEEFEGVTIGRIDSDGAGSLITLDTIGRVDDEISLSDSCWPYWVDLYGDGWVVNKDYATVASVDASGDCTDLADFSDAEVYEFGVYGIATYVDGTVLAVTVGSLVDIGADGTITELAAWTVDLADPTVHEFAATSVAVDLATGEVGLFDYFGGFATWSADDGFTIHKSGNIEAPELVTSSGAHQDGGGWYTEGISASGYGLYRFDLDAADWVLEQPWDTDSDWSPQQVAIDGDSGDWYVTANAPEGGVYPTVFRVDKDNGYTADLYRIELDGGDFYGIVSNYTYGE